MILYTPYQMHLEHAELGPYTTYGIRILEQTEDRTRELARIPDVSTDEMAVASLCAQATRCKLSPLHIGDVLEDFLAG